MLNNVQYLRGMAALMVVAFHVLAPSARLPGSDDLPAFYAGQGGVDLFFVISGFIIWHTTQSAEADPGRFLVRRIKRIVPLYWVLTIAMAAIALMLPSLLGSTRFDPAHVVASLLFLPWPHPTLHQMNPVLFVGWSLNYEMAFYLVFALLLAFTPYVRGFVAIGFGIAVVALGLAIDDGGITDFYTAPVVLEFLFGIAIAMAFSTRLEIPRSLCALLVAGGFTAMIALGEPGLHRVIWAGLPSAAIVFGAVFAERQGTKRSLVLPMLVGAASYSIYLSHVFVLPMVQVVWTHLLPEVSTWLIPTYAAAATFACLAAGVATYLLVEIPLSHLADWTDNRLSRTRSRPTKALSVRYLQVLRP